MSLEVLAEPSCCYDQGQGDFLNFPMSYLGALECFADEVYGVLLAGVFPD